MFHVLKLFIADLVVYSTEIQIWKSRTKQQIDLVWLSTTWFCTKLSSLNHVEYGWCSSVKLVWGTDGDVFGFILNKV